MKENEKERLRAMCYRFASILDVVEKMDLLKKHPEVNEAGVFKAILSVVVEKYYGMTSNEAKQLYEDIKKFSG